MPYLCKYCKSEFAFKSNLNKHQISSKYCIGLQTARGIKVDATNYLCACGSEFTTKGNLKRHKTKCDKIAIIDQDTIEHPLPAPPNPIENKKIETPGTYSVSNLTPEYVMTVLEPVLNDKVLKLGMSAVVDLIIDLLLQRDDKYIYYCMDKSEEKFAMLINREGKLVEMLDPAAFLIRQILYPPLNLLALYIARNSEDQDVLDTAKDINNLKLDGSSFRREMGSKLPMNTDGIPGELAELLVAIEEFEREHTTNS